MNPFTMGKIGTEVYLIIMLAIIFAQWKKSNRESRAFGIAALFIALGNLFEILSWLLPENFSAIVVLMSIIFGNVSLPFMAFFFLHRVNDDANKTVLLKNMPKVMIILSAVNIALTIVAFILIITHANEGIFTEMQAYGVLCALEALAGLIMCLILTAKHRFIRPGTLLILLFPILFSDALLVIETIFPNVSIGYIGISIGVFLQYITLLRRIGTEAELKEQITSEILRTDVMTQLMNRHAFSEFLNEHDGACDAGVMFFDINGLKKANDELGHAEGDKLIIRCARLLNNSLLNAALYRISGDEFVAIYWGNESHRYFDKEADEIKIILRVTGSWLSAGAFWGEQMKLVDTIGQAEERMYDDKRAYYESSGLERRHA